MTYDDLPKVVPSQPKPHPLKDADILLKFYSTIGVNNHVEIETTIFDEFSFVTYNLRRVTMCIAEQAQAPTLKGC